MEGKEHYKTFSTGNVPIVFQGIWQVLTVADKILIIMIIIGIIGLFIYYRSTDQEGRKVRIEAPEQIYFLPFDQTTVIKVKGTLGSSQIEINLSGARFNTSPCLHKICIKNGWIRLAGEVAACVPNRVILTVEGKALPKGLDAVSR